MSKNCPLITVCIPTYNHGRFIDQTILSVINQGYPNLQIIISDDCSTDNTQEIILFFKGNYPDLIEIQLHPFNKGPVDNVQSIYPLIKGDYVCWFSGDDIFLPNKLHKQVNYMLENQDCILSYHAVNVIDEKGHFLYEFNDPLFGVKSHFENITSNLIKHRCFICANSIMINTSLAKKIKHNKDVGICNDWLLSIELSLNGKIHYLPDVLAAYRRHEKSISKNININYEEKIFNYLLTHYPIYKADIYNGLAQMYCMYFFKYLLNGNLLKSVYCLKKLSVVIVSFPRNFLSVLNKIFTETCKRIRLFKITKSIYS